MGRAPMSADPPVSADALAAMDRETFVRTFGGVFERSPWVAEAAFAAGPFRDLEALQAAMLAVVQRAPRARQLALVRAHPDLADKAATAETLTEDSRREQASAGLDRLTPAEYRRFHALNRAYREKFGFPFVIAVRGLDKQAILDAFAERLESTPEAELERALAEIGRIARLRLEALVAA